MILEGIKYIIGLGNPGSAYLTTPHNLGFIFVDMLIKQMPHVEELRFDKQKSWKAGAIVLSKPNTFMNNSGEAIKVLKKHDSRSALDFMRSLLIVHDDIGLAMHRIAYKDGGGLAGHNGLRDIVKKLMEMGLNMEEARSFKRLRLGCDVRDRDRLSDYVTRPMSPENTREWFLRIDEYLAEHFKSISF